MSVGMATSAANETLEDVVKRADIEMLQAKRSYYEQPERDRRSRTARNL
jgi:GGDEF domain-containing protein